ncbi:MAG: TonB-dependent receptor domain-containing protein [Bryobacteraceae bacterium]
MQRISFFLVFLLAAIPLAQAQFKAEIQGTVTDSSGAVIPGADVSLTNLETGKVQKTTTSGEGFYHFAGLAPGRYTVTASKAAFKQSSIQDLKVNAEEKQGANLTLDPGAITESVTVQGEAAAILPTENANVSGTISTADVRQLPQVGRDPYELVRLAPGVFGDGARSGNGQSTALPNGNVGPGGSNQSIFQTENQMPISANGQRISQNSYEIDGVSVNSLGYGGAAVVTPNQESVKEIHVSSSDYEADKGRNSGAQVEVVSQNGTNRFHGSGVFKYNDPKFNAYNKYGGTNGAPIRVNQYLRDFAASLGGPVWKEKLFFFFSYEGLRNNSTNYTNSFVETPQFRQQVIAARPGSNIATIFQNANIAPRLGGVQSVGCPTGFAAGTCQAVNGGLDIGSLTGARGQYTGIVAGALDGIPDIQFARIASPNMFTGDQYNGRVDYNLGLNAFALTTYFTHVDRLDSDPGGGSRPLDDLRATPLNSAITFTYNRTITATLLNEARFNFTRFSFNQVAASSNTNFGIPRLEVEGLPLPDRIRFGAPQSESTPGIFAQNTYEFRDSLSKVWGNHVLKAGVEVRKEQDNNNLVGGARPLYSFQGLNNLANDAPVFEQINADPTTGAPASAQRYFRTSDYAGYVQDDWKMRPNLTLTFGLRYEYFSPLTEKRGRISNLDFGPYTLTNAKLRVSDQLFNGDKNNFAPRFGFAYSPGQKQNIAIRGGFGVYYDRVPNVLFDNTRGNPPFFARYGICCGTSATPFAGGQIQYALGSSNSIYSYPANPMLAVGIDPNTGGPLNRTVEIWGAQRDFPNAYAYIYSLNADYRLPYQLIASAGYQGSTDHKLIRIVNQAFLYPNLANPAFSPVYFPQPDVNSNFNALNLGLNRQFAKGFGVNAKYRWAKSIDENSNEGPGFVTNGTFPQDLRQERGPSDFDVRHYFQINGIYELPMFRRQQGFLGKLLGGYQISGIETWHRGFPWTPVIGQSVHTPGGPTLAPTRPTQYFGGAGTDTSNQAFITGSNFAGGGAKYFNTTASGPPGVGRNSFRGPHFFGTDISLIKQTRLSDKWHLGEAALLDIRANLYNAFNNLNLAPFNFNDIGTQADNSIFFGRSSAALAGRVVEFQARLTF